MHRFRTFKIPKDFKIASFIQVTGVLPDRAKPFPNPGKGPVSVIDGGGRLSCVYYRLGTKRILPKVVLTSLHQIFHHLKGEQHTKVEAEIIAQANSQQGSDC